MIITNSNYPALWSGINGVLKEMMEDCRVSGRREILLPHIIALAQTIRIDEETVMRAVARRGEAMLKEADNG